MKLSSGVPEVQLVRFDCGEAKTEHFDDFSGRNRIPEIPTSEKILIRCE